MASARHLGLPVALAVLLGGCISASPEQWTHSPDEQTAARAAIYQCRAHADGIGREHAAWGGVVMPLAGIFKRRAVFEECMAARGYRRQ